MLSACDTHQLYSQMIAMPKFDCYFPQVKKQKFVKARPEETKDCF